MELGGGYMKNFRDKFKTVEFKQNGDERGHLVVVEGNQDIPFDIKRVFYIYGSDADVIRGQHANRKTEFVLINVSGTSKVGVDDGFNQEIVELDKPHKGIYLSKMLWKNMYDFSNDSVLLVLASEHYDPSEYIRDYDEFLTEVGRK
jgi:dTDP-4-dehydrorhamnose 3,5-epimerase-like enzyme